MACKGNTEHIFRSENKETLVVPYSQAYDTIVHTLKFKKIKN